jgi:peptide subunit release factor 1 (eRF1)
MSHTVSQLESFRGDHTSVVSYVISPTTSILDAHAFIQSEIVVASNIKDKTNRHNVITAYKGILDMLTNVKITPSTGIAMYAGWCI